MLLGFRSTYLLRGWRYWVLAYLCIKGVCGVVLAQTASTGALAGVTMGASRAALPGVKLKLINVNTSESQSTISDDEGRFGFFLLAPGDCLLQATKTGFETLSSENVAVSVTETRRIELHLRLATVKESVHITSETPLVQTDDSALGRVVNGKAMNRLPLVTRNFAQIAGLSPGVMTGVFNAGELGVGGIALSQISQSNDGIFAHGSRSYQNEFQLDGISVSDVQSTASASGGIPIPNPDTIQEFKMQTAQYDAAFGRFGGANVSVVTKAGGSEFHATLFEFFRNNVLNANDFFSNRTGQPRGVLQQNQFGLAVGGPILKDKLFFFGSYQGTRQLNGVAAGQLRIQCTATLSTPPLTNDRSAEALGALFGGMHGALGGVAVNSDGSNINPVALTLLNFKLPNAKYLIPTPETVNTSKPFDSQGFSMFSQPCPFYENQFATNVDYSFSQKSRLSVRFFFANDSETVSFPGNGLNTVGNIAGFSSPGNSIFRVLSLAHSYAISSTWLNEVRFGFVRTSSSTRASAPFKWTDVGVSESNMNSENSLPSLSILGSASLASAFPRTYAQNSFVLSDGLSYVRGAHAVLMGGSLTRLQDNLDPVGVGSFLQFLSWPDFLLGLNASGNGTGTFSNVFASVDAFGPLNREYRAWEGSAFVRDNYRVTSSLTLNLGLRYERMGQFADNLGKNSSFDFSKADANPPPGGSLAGYLVASNFPGTPPSGVTRTDNPFGNDGAGQNTLAPRLGFAWQVLPRTGRLVLRGGYGMYFSQPTGQAFSVSATGAPFSLPRLSVGRPNAKATFEEPFAQPFPTPESFPLFVPYRLGGNSSVNTTAPGFRPALVQQYSLNLQTELYPGWLLEVGYVGTRGTHSQRYRSLNQAQEASPQNPIRGQISDTLANIPLRVPIPGIPADSLREMETEGSSWYNGLEASLTKQLSHGVQFLASYTFSKTLDTDGADINGTSAGNTLTLGDQNASAERWGRASFDRPHRFVLSAVWTMPSPGGGVKRLLFGDWAAAGVVTVQSGSALTIAYTNARNVFGISEDRAGLTGTCTKGQLVRPGSVQSNLDSYLNTSCFTTPPVIGADGIGTAFGNSATGIVDGPGQANLDFSVSKLIHFSRPREASGLEVRVEFYNAFNHPQFGSPDTNFASATFGVISSTAVNARVGQLALRLDF